MFASVNTDRKHAFVLKRDQVKQVWDYLQSRIGRPEIIIRCSDEVSREYDNWKRFSTFENPPAKKIKRLILRATSEDHTKRAKIEFSDSPYRVIDIDIEASEQVVTNLYGDICDLLDGTKPWYSRFTRLDSFYVMASVFVLGSIFSTLYMSGGAGQEKWSMTAEQALLGTVILALVFVFIGVLVWGLSRFKQRFFPIAYFAIGQGLGRYELDEKCRWGVIVAFIISISSSAVFALF